MEIITRSIREALRKPSKGFWGWFATNRCKKVNSFLEKNAVEMCQIDPNHNVLEIGFGPGIGLQEAYKKVQGGDGCVYGVDFSMYVVENAYKNFEKEIAEEKLKVYMGDVMLMPFKNDTFDRVFHCNCYYFWPDVMLSAAEIYRVMKPHTYMITTLNMDRLKEAVKSGFLTKSSVDPLKYMYALEKMGFQNVKIDYLKDNDVDFQCITAEIHEKKDSVLDVLVEEKLKELGHMTESERTEASKVSDL